MNGLDKGLVELEGKKLISYVINQLKNQVTNIYISCNRNPDEYQKFGLPLLNDEPFPSEGPLCAIAAGLQKIPCERLLIVPCDTPFLPDNLLALLKQGMDSGSYKIACIHNDEHIQPLFCMIDKSLSSSLEVKVKSGLRKTQDWIYGEKHILVNDTRSSLYTNLNQTLDLEKIVLEKMLTRDS